MKQLHETFHDNSCVCVFMCSWHRGAVGADGWGDHRFSVRSSQRLLPKRIWLLQQDHQRVCNHQVRFSPWICTSHWRLIQNPLWSLLDTFSLSVLPLPPIASLHEYFLCQACSKGRGEEKGMSQSSVRHQSPARYLQQRTHKLPFELVVSLFWYKKSPLGYWLCHLYYWLPNIKSMMWFNLSFIINRMKQCQASFLAVNNI